ncbi:MAG TPA: hypothetical protein VF006_23950 [Longimicrobium sp.]
MADTPKLLGRVYAWLQDEVPATTLEAYRRASLPVFEVMDLAEARRLECATDGLDPWTVPPAIRAEFLCAWNAFVLQTLGNDILDADYDASPATVGFVPPETARQVLAFYAQVEEWLNRARQAHASPDYRLDVEVPAELPRWTVAHPSPREHLVGVLRAMRSVGDHAAAAMAFLPDRVPDDAAQRSQLNRIRQLYASAESKARYALDLHGAAATREVHERVEPYARDAIELFYELGQLVADPSLATDPAPPAIAAPAAVPPPSPVDGTPPSPAEGTLPGQPGFDPWCLTDPQAAAQLRGNRRAQRAVRKMWRLDPDPARTLAIHAEIQAAFQRGQITFASTGTERVGYFHCCPWGAVYVANQPVKLGGTALRTLQRFVYDVGALNEAEKFRRRVLVGNFQETGDLQYGPHRPTP